MYATGDIKSKNTGKLSGTDIVMVINNNKYGI
jgi:hypothetical protein